MPQGDGRRDRDEGRHAHPAHGRPGCREVPVAEVYEHAGAQRDLRLREVRISRGSYGSRSQGRLRGRQMDAGGRCAGSGGQGSGVHRRARQDDGPGPFVPARGDGVPEDICRQGRNHGDPPVQMLHAGCGQPQVRQVRGGLPHRGPDRSAARTRRRTPRSRSTS